MVLCNKRASTRIRIDNMNPNDKSALTAGELEEMFQVKELDFTFENVLGIINEFNSIWKLQTAQKDERIRELEMNARDEYDLKWNLINEYENLKSKLTKLEKDRDKYYDLWFEGRYPKFKQ